MRSTRPPVVHFKSLGLLLLMAISATNVFGQALKLPDLVLPRNLRPDIPQPAEYEHAGTYWEAGKPRFRRVYPLFVAEATDSQKIPVDTVGISRVEAIPTSKAVSTTTNSSSDVQNPWFASVSYNLQEGAGLTVGRWIGPQNSLVAESYLPLGISPTRPYVVGLRWNHTENIEAEAQVGVKIESRTIPYGLLGVRWIRPVGSPDDYELAYRSLGGSSGGLGGRAAVNLDTPVGNGRWSAGGSLGGGGWYSSSKKSWTADGSAWAGYQVLEGKLLLQAGLHGLIQGTGRFMLAPDLKIVWRPTPNWSIFVESGLDFRFEGEESLVLESIDSFDPEIPSYAEYSFGFSSGKDGIIQSRVVFRGGYGRYVFGANTDVYVSDDSRLGFNADISLITDIGRINLMGVADHYLAEETTIWDSLIGLEIRRFDTYFRAGSEEAIIGDGLPGLRTDLPIIGLGVDWSPYSYLDFGIFVYSDLEFSIPSIVLNMNWRN